MKDKRKESECEGVKANQRKLPLCLDTSGAITYEWATG